MIFKTSLLKPQIIFSLTVLCLICFNCRAQDQQLINTQLPELTTDEMLEDFDSFLNTVKNYSPQTPVRKAVTGIDPLEELYKMQSKIPNIKSTEAFANLILSAITVLQDGHSSLLWPRGYSSEELKELGFSDITIELFPLYYELRRSKGIQKKFNLKLKYLDGQYYNIMSFVHNGVHYDSGLRLVAINDQHAQDFIGALYPYKYRMRWDYSNKRYYSENFYRALNFEPEQRLKLKFVNKNKEVFMGEFKQNEAIAYGENQDSDVSRREKKVEYFEEEQILYIRIPKMNLDHIDFYPEEIRAKASGKPLKKVIIDIRDNTGGTDNVWVKVLSSIINKPIDFELLLLAVPSEEMKNRYPEDSPNWKSYKATFLDDYEYAVFASGDRKIEPDSTSLNFKGKIYILQNENIYSSSGALAAIGMLAENIYTVGQNTGQLLGRGINPFVFELPNSKILYRIEPVIDFQNVENALDVYHDNVEIPVELNIDQYLKRINHRGDIYGRDFLFNHDPVFMRVLQD
ncbi:S41 family peptidase [Winogradskyella sp.]|uniref:S41 family peptidase n=1 Tax=Winogradskyella sp. TaxID=1883156 RepID=UPI003BA8BEE1